MVPKPVPADAAQAPALRLQLLIVCPGGRWQAQLTAPNGEHLLFDSPFELVRYLTQLAQQPGAPGLR